MECDISFCVNCLAKQYLSESDALNAANKLAALGWILEGRCAKATDMINGLGGRDAVLAQREIYQNKTDEAIRKLMGE